MSGSVVITGGDGFIGSHLAKYLSNKDYSIYALTIKGSPLKDRIEGINGLHIIECDLLNYEEIIDMLPKNPDAVFHFAWAGVSPESRRTFDVQKVNLELTYNAIKLAASINAQKFIFPGSTMEYSYSNHIINSEAVPSPQNAYGAIKIACRYMCEVICKDFGIAFNYVVISSIYSEDRIDNNVIYYTIKSLLNGEKPQLTKLEQLWDYVHSDDVMHGLFLVMVYGKNGRFYTIGHGDNWSLANYIYKIRDIIDPSLELGIGEVPYGDDRIPMSCVDLSTIKEDTGFEPQIPFDIGIRSVIERVKERMV